MKIKHLFATTLSLALVACQVAAPVNTSLNVTPKTQVAQTLTLAKPALPQLDTQATVTQTSNTEQVKVQIKLPKALQTGFRTQLADRDQLAFIKVSLKGQGISGTVTHEGAAFLPVSGDTVTATLEDIPLKDGDLRVVMVQGYNAARQPLGAFEARGYYRSRAGVRTITITLRRSMILLGRILEQALVSNPALLDVLDVEALQEVLEEVTGYNEVTGEFGTDPSRFDAADILAMIPVGGSPLPAGIDIAGNAVATTHDVSFTVETPNGALTNEAVRLILTDPSSNAKLLPSRTASGSSVTFANVVVGTWTLSAYDSDGNLLVSTQVVVSESGVTVTDNPLTLNGVEQYNPEFRVNTYTTDGQLGQAIAMDSDGDYVLTWQSTGQDGSGDGVYAQRYNSMGVAQGSEFKINTFTSGSQSNPAIAMDSDGDFVVSWESLNQDGNSNGVYAQRYNSIGVAQGSEFKVNTFTSGGQSNPAIAMDSDGDFVISWTSNNQDGNGDGVYAQRYNSAGTALGSEFRVNSVTTSTQSNPAIAMDSDGDFVVSWQSALQDGSNFGIYGQRYNSMGVAQNSEFRVNSYTSSIQEKPAIAMDSDGDFVVCWHSYTQDGSGYGIYAQRYNSAGAVQGSEFPVNTETSSLQKNPTIAMDSDGDFVVTWDSYYQDGSGNGVYAQRYNSAGVAQNSEFRVNTYTSSLQRIPAIAMDSDGDFVVTWDSFNQDGSSYGVYSKRYNAAGAEQ